MSTQAFFSQDMAQGYDQRNSALRPISDCLHFLTGLVLAELRPEARILCVGVGTGGEMLSLAADHPQWSFVGVDPSAAMLDVCRLRLRDGGIQERCELIEGYVEDVRGHDFDAVVSLFVAHFVALGERPAFYRAIHELLRPGGRFVSAEISTDLDAPEFPSTLENWKQVQALMGATAESLATLEGTLRNVLSVLPPDPTHTLWRDAGFTTPVSFFQAFMIRGWYAEKRQP